MAIIIYNYSTVNYESEIKFLNSKKKKFFSHWSKYNFAIKKKT